MVLGPGHAQAQAQAAPPPVGGHGHGHGHGGQQPRQPHQLSPADALELEAYAAHLLPLPTPPDGNITSITGWAAPFPYYPVAGDGTSSGPEDSDGDGEEVEGRGGSTQAAVRGASPLSLAALNGLPSLTGLWLDPDEWDEEEEAEQQPAHGQSSGSSGAPPVVEEVRVGSVRTRLHRNPDELARALGQAAVQDAAPHLALLTRLRRLRSLAFGDRRVPFLGLGDDSAELLACLKVRWWWATPTPGLWGRGGVPGGGQTLSSPLPVTSPPLAFGHLLS